MATYMKYLKVPTVLTQFPANYGLLRVKDFLAIASFEHTHQSSGGMFLEEHLLLFVLEGTNTLIHGQHKYVVRKNQMLLLPQGTIWEYKKEGNPATNIYDSMLFFLKDDFLKDFIKMSKVTKYAQKNISTAVKPVNEHLQAYLNSIKPYFRNVQSIESDLLRLKMMELLYDLALEDRDVLHQILQLRQPAKADITSVIEQNYTLHLSLPELACLSGRSLSSFKRDFVAIYNTSPSKWIRDRKLEKTKELLSSTLLSIADIAYMSGFENTTHFSRIFKEKFGYSPSESRKIELNRNIY